MSVKTRSAFAKRLRELRESRGLNQGQLADILGIPRTTLAHYETGERIPRNERLKQIAEFFKEDEMNLLGMPLTIQEQINYGEFDLDLFKNFMRQVISVDDVSTLEEVHILLQNAIKAVEGKREILKSFKTHHA